MIAEPVPSVVVVRWAGALGSTTAPDHMIAAAEAPVSAMMLMWALAWAAEVDGALRLVLHDGAMGRPAERPWALARLFRDALSKATRIWIRSRGASCS